MRFYPYCYVEVFSLWHLGMAGWFWYHVFSFYRGRETLGPVLSTRRAQQRSILQIHLAEIKGQKIARVKLQLYWIHHFRRDHNAPCLSPKFAIWWGGGGGWEGGRHGALWIGWKWSIDKMKEPVYALDRGFFCRKKSCQEAGVNVTVV